MKIFSQERPSVKGHYLTPLQINAPKILTQVGKGRKWNSYEVSWRRRQKDGFILSFFLDFFVFIRGWFQGISTSSIHFCLHLCRHITRSRSLHHLIFFVRNDKIVERFWRWNFIRLYEINFSLQTNFGRNSWHGDKKNF